VKDRYANDSYFDNVIAKCAKGACDGFFMHKGYLFKIGKLCFPTSSLRELLMKEAQDGDRSGHFDEKKTYELVKEHFFWPSMLKDVHKVIESVLCARRLRAKRMLMGFICHHLFRISHERILLVWTSYLGCLEHNVERIRLWLWFIDSLKCHIL